MTNVSHSNPDSPRLVAEPRRRGWWKLLLAIAFAFMLYFGADRIWHRVIRDYFYPRNWGVVEPGKVFRSGLISHRIIAKTLKDNHVATIICMTGDDLQKYDTQVECDVCAQLGIRRFDFNLNGNGTGNSTQYIDALAELAAAEKANMPVLVHCKTGAQRTGAMIAFYRVLIEARSGKQAYAELLEYGHDPQKNPLLVPYLNQHMREIAQGLADKGVIKQVPSPLPVIEP